MKYNDSHCRIYCPINNHGKDVATGYTFIPCSDYQKQICDFLKKEVK